MRNLISKILRENLQQADKLYFKSGILSPEEKSIVISITNGDAFTRLVCDLGVHMKKFNSSFERDRVLLVNFHTGLKNYDKTVFPFGANLDNYGLTDSNELHVLTLFELVSSREYAVKALRKLPSVAIRNMKAEIKTPTTSKYVFDKLAEDINSLSRVIKNIPDNDKTKPLMGKIFNSKHNLKQMLEVALHYKHAFTGIDEDISMEDVLEQVQYVDADVVQKSGNILVLRVNSNDAMITVGGMSLWCFSRPNSISDWYSYAPSGFVYVIFNFNDTTHDAKFMMVYLPDSGAVYASTNVPLEELGVDDSDEYLRSIGVDMGKIDSDSYDTSKGEREVYDDEYEIPEEPKAKRKAYVDPRQMSLFESKTLIKTLLKEELSVLKK